MPISERLHRLGGGVFARTDQRKQLYRQQQGTGNGLPLLDLSLGSSDLSPPARVLEAMAEAIHDSGSAAYCLNAGTAPFSRPWRIGVSLVSALSSIPSQRFNFLSALRKARRIFPWPFSTPATRPWYSIPAIRRIWAEQSWLVPMFCVCPEGHGRMASGPRCIG